MWQILTAVVLGFGVNLVAAQAEEVLPQTAYDTPEFGKAVRGYLLKNPEVLLEAFYLLEEKEKRKKSVLDADLIAANGQVIFGDTRDGFLGSDGGEKVFVEFFDYNCGYCRTNLSELKKFIEDNPDVKLVLKEYPILGAASELAAKTALAVKVLYGNVAYIGFHERLLTMKGQTSPAFIDKLLRETGFDVARIQEASKSAEITKHLEANRDLARKLKISGTPGFVFHGSIHRGAIEAREIARRLIAKPIQNGESSNP